MANIVIVRSPFSLTHAIEERLLWQILARLIICRGTYVDLNRGNDDELETVT